jgi:Tfp pilus assembly protein PilN
VRPINLIPQEERRSHGTSTRSGPLAYIVVGSLVALLVGIVVLVLTSNQISERETEVAKLEEQKAVAVARADRLAPYTSFEQVAAQRVLTASALADSRFDWPRVIRQLSLVLPPAVYFESLAGSAGGVGGTEGVAAGVSGPSLTMKGCAPGQDTVAAFVAALKEIDGVTRVGLSKSAMSSDSAEEDRKGYCALGEKAQFEIVVAFDAAPPSPDATEAPPAEVAAPEEAPAESSEASTEPPESTETTG